MYQSLNHSKPCRTGREEVRRRHDSEFICRGGKTASMSLLKIVSGKERFSFTKLVWSDSIVQCLHGNEGEKWGQPFICNRGTKLVPAGELLYGPEHSIAQYCWFKEKKLQVLSAVFMVVPFLGCFELNPNKH